MAGATCVLEASCDRERGDPGHLPPLSRGGKDKGHCDKEHCADWTGHRPKAFSKALRPRHQQREDHCHRRQDRKDLQHSSGDAKNAKQPQSASPTVLHPLHEKRPAQGGAQGCQLIRTRTQRLFDEERVRRGEDRGDDAAPSSTDSEPNAADQQDNGTKR